MPAGARVGVSVEVKDGKLGEATLMAGINGRSLNCPDFLLPADMHSLAALTTGNGPVGATSSAALGFIDLEHAQLDITNATFAKGRVSLPGGVAELAEGSKRLLPRHPDGGRADGRGSPERRDGGARRAGAAGHRRAGRLAPDLATRRRQGHRRRGPDQPRPHHPGRHPQGRQRRLRLAWCRSHLGRCSARQYSTRAACPAPTCCRR